ncbi:hypothetical protein B5G20_03265 [Collinsella sp. An7]|uniref:hypothetical protein n=1 Tax=Collinsella sp. An7 TaxID=1965651 RepID=UPI000B368E04|nr:hypothetical protein [Collinsella sp. An7]OUN47752.1 hypothetical protein B5G20_03265 [Collinsella sp. An7]
MPVIKTTTSVAIPEEARVELKTAFGQAISAIPGKSEGWLMCVFTDETPIYFAGDDSQPSALIEVGVFARSEVPADAWTALVEAITPAVAEVLGIDPARIYVSCSSTPNFGWNGTTF